MNVKYWIKKPKLWLHGDGKLCGIKEEKIPLEYCNKLGFIFSTLFVETTMIDANNIC